MTKKKKASTSGVLYIRNIPKVVKDQFKALCAANGLSMQEAIAIMMAKCVEAKEIGN